MKVSLVIPAYNEEAYIGACVESVQESAPGRFEEIIVVDNASTDRTAEVASRYPGVRVVKTAVKGLTRARQAGLEAARGELVAFIDADCRMDAQWLPTVEAHFAKYPSAVSLTGPVWYYDGPHAMRWLIVVLEWLSLPPAYAVAGYLVIGGNFVARRDALFKIGGFDTNIRFFGEDADIARRLSAVGPVYLRMHFAIATSMRRFAHDGFLQTCFNYVMNFAWHVLFGRSYTHAYTDARS